MTPYELVQACEAALTKPGGSRRLVLPLRQPKVLGETGRYEDETRYWYTKAQCRRMIDKVYAAARDDLGSA